MEGVFGNKSDKLYNSLTHTSLQWLLPLIIPIIGNQTDKKIAPVRNLVILLLY